MSDPTPATHETPTPPEPQGNEWEVPRAFMLTAIGLALAVGFFASLSFWLWRHMGDGRPDQRPQSEQTIEGADRPGLGFTAERLVRAMQASRWSFDSPGGMLPVGPPVRQSNGLDEQTFALREGSPTLKMLGDAHELRYAELTAPGGPAGRDKYPETCHQFAALAGTLVSDQGHDEQEAVAWLMEALRQSGAMDRKPPPNAPGNLTRDFGSVRLIFHKDWNAQALVLSAEPVKPSAVK